MLDSSFASWPPFSVENSDAAIDRVQPAFGTITVAPALSSDDLENGSISLRVAARIVGDSDPGEFQ